MMNDLTVGKPEAVLWKFCIPLFGSIVFQQLYNIADSFVAGKFIGENALAAVYNNSFVISSILINPLNRETPDRVHRPDLPFLFQASHRRPGAVVLFPRTVWIPSPRSQKKPYIRPYS
jgi:hypothetical protein